MDTLSVNGNLLSACALGQGETLVMLHGLVSGSMASWYFSVALPLSASRRTVLYDQRGHGGSSMAASGYDLDSQAVDLDAVITHYGADAHDGKVDLIGHSMGALIGLYYALHKPQRVRRLVLVDAPLPARDFIAPSLMQARTREGLQAYVAEQCPAEAAAGGRRRTRLQQRLESLFFESSLVGDVLAMGAPADAALAALELPVLLIYGRHSPCFGVGQRLARLLPEAQLLAVDGGHYLPEEAPAAILQGVQEFFARELVFHGQE